MLGLGLGSGPRVWLGLEPPPPQPLHLRVRARELRVETHIESRVEIDRAWAIAQQAVQLGAARGGTGGCWLKCSAREVVRGEVERLECEHRCCGRSGALRRPGGLGGVRGTPQRGDGEGRRLPLLTCAYYVQRDESSSRHTAWRRQVCGGGGRGETRDIRRPQHRKASLGRG